VGLVVPDERGIVSEYRSDADDDRVGFGAEPVDAGEVLVTAYFDLFAPPR